MTKFIKTKRIKRRKKEKLDFTPKKKNDRKVKKNFLLSETINIKVKKVLRKI